MSLTQPPLNPIPFALNSVLKNIIPITTTVEGKASFELGFTEANMRPIGSKGIPPSGRDFNGIFFYLSEHQVWLNAGGTYKFSAELAAALGGYQKGAIVASNNGLRLYVSTVDGNTTDFNTDMTGWKLIATSELQSLLDGLQGNIDNEAAIRAEADIALQTNIDNEATTRLDADEALQANLDTETANRTDADTVLQTNIDNEANTRLNADATLQVNIDNEAAVRFNDDNVEREARIAGDNALDVRVKFLEEKPDQPAIGVGQAFSDKTGSRFSGVTYPNTTGKPLEVVIFLIGANDYATCDFFVGGEFVFSLANRDAAGQSKGCSVIIPVNSNCRIDGSFTSWRELG